MSENNKKMVGQRLHLLRIEKGLTQEQMGEMLNISTSAYCKIEYGDTDLTLTRITKIADTFGMSEMELFGKITNNSMGYDYHESSLHSVTYERSLIKHIDSLKELVKSNSKLIDHLSKRIVELEKK